MAILLVAAEQLSEMPVHVKNLGDCILLILIPGWKNKEILNI